MNRTEVMERLQPMLSLRAIPVTDTPRTRVLTEPRLAVRTGPSRLLPVAEHGVPNFLQFLGLPQRVAQRLQPQTLGRAATELLVAQERCTLLVQDGEVTDVVPACYRPLDAERVLRTVERAIPDADYHRVLTLPHHVVRLEIVGVEERAVSPGDLVRAGALVAFSPIGVVEPLVQSYALRLVCTNGATATEVLREFRYGGEDDNIWPWFRQSARDAYRSLRRVVEDWRHMAAREVRPEDRAPVLEGLLRQTRITGDEADAVRARALEQPPQNEFDMHQLITWATSHVMQEPGAIIRAQRVAATFSSEAEHRRVCPACHRAR